MREYSRTLEEGPCLPLTWTSSSAMSLGECRAKTNPNRDRFVPLSSSGSVVEKPDR